MIRVLVLVLALLGCAAPVAAETGLLLDAEPGFLLAAPTNVSTNLILENDISWVREADFNNGLGSVSIISGSVSADYSIFHLTYELSHFDWATPSQVARTLHARRVEAPWRDLHDVTFQARLLNNTFGDHKWRYWVNGEVNSSFEESFPGAVGVGVDGGLAYDIWNGWMVGMTARTLAVSALSEDLFGEVEFGLAVAVSQRTIREALKAMGIVDEDKEGANRFSLNFALSRAEKVYRLRADNPVYGNGYVSMVRSKAGVYLDCMVTDNLILSGGPEYHYMRKFELYNKAGIYQSSHELDDAMGGYFRFSWRF